MFTPFGFNHPMAKCIMLSVAVVKQIQVKYEKQLGGIICCIATDISVRSTEHAKHGATRGSGGMPPRKFLKNMRLILVNFVIKITNSCKHINLRATVIAIWCS